MSQIQSEDGPSRKGYRFVQIGPEKLEIPEKWRVTTVGEVASRFISGGTPDSENENYWGGDIPWTTCAVVDGPQFTGQKDYITQEGLDNSSASLIPEGSILFGTRVNVANVGRTTKEIAISQDLIGIVLNEECVDSSFVTWYLLFNQSKIRDRYSQGSTIQGMITADLKALPLLLPPISEQRRIADILGTVEKQIQNTENTLEYLKEIRDGLVQNLMKNGVKSESSKEFQIGPRNYSFPEEWAIREVGEMLDQSTDHKAIRGGPPGGKLKKGARTPDGPKLYVQENVINKDYELGDEYLPEGKLDELSGAIIESGDVLITRAGTDGYSDVFPETAPEGIMDSNLIRLKVDEEQITPEYLSTYIAKSSVARFQINSMSHGGTRSNLNNQIVKSLKVPVPPVSEQKHITKIINLAEERMRVENNLNTKYEELKRGLMQDLLTGKVRVSTD